MGTSLIRYSPPIGTYGTPMPEPFGDPRGGGVSDDRGTPVEGTALRPAAEYSHHASTTMRHVTLPWDSCHSSLEETRPHPVQEHRADGERVRVHGSGLRVRGVPHSSERPPP